MLCCRISPHFVLVMAETSLKCTCALGQYHILDEASLLASAEEETVLAAKPVRKNDGRTHPHVLCCQGEEGLEIEACPDEMSLY